MPDDIRDVPTDEYWEAFEKKWTGLLSYRYLGRRHGIMDTGVERETMVLRSDMRNSVGGIMAAPLCIASPESGGMADDLFVPNPVIASMQDHRRRARRPRDRDPERDDPGRAADGFQPFEDRRRRQSGSSDRALGRVGREHRPTAARLRARRQPGDRRRRLTLASATPRRVRRAAARTRCVGATGAQRRAVVARRGVAPRADPCGARGSGDGSRRARGGNRRGAGRRLARDVRRARQGRSVPCETARQPVEPTDGSVAACRCTTRATTNRVVTSGSAVFRVACDVRPAT